MNADDTHQRGHRQILRSATLMTFMTVLSRILGLVREQVRAVFLGTGASSDAFGLATTIPNLFRRLFAEGAMTAAFVPILTEHLQTSTLARTREFLSRFVTLLTFAVTLFTVAAILATPWLIDTFFSAEFRHVPGKVVLTTTLTQLMWPYLVLVTLAAVVQGILNAHKIFGPSAFAPVLMNAGIIGGAVAFRGTFADPSYALVIGFLAGGFLQLVFQIPWLFRDTPIRFGLDLHFRDPEVRRVLKVMVPGIFAAGIYQFNVFASQIIASGLAEGSVSSLQYSLRLQELVLGVFVVSVAQVILPSLSEHTAQGDHDGVRSTVSYAVRLIAFITLPATAVLVILGRPIVEALFQFGAFSAESTAKTALALTFHAMGLFFIGQARVLSQAFFAYKDLRTPTYIAAVDAALNIALCVLLSEVLGHGGIALASTLAAVANSVLLHVFLARKTGGLDLADLIKRSSRIALASAVMAAAILGLEALWPPVMPTRLALIGWIFVALTIAAVSYLGASSLFQVNELSSLLSAVRRRLRPKAR
jgi:putative peptidoglycan lipid II flippase